MKNCPHEDNILYGKAIRINKLNRVIQVMCDSCRAYGTIYEKREKHSSNSDWYEVTEQWHKMTFGKFAGQRMSDVPTSYLQWGVENINSEAIKQKLQTELSKRLD